jgi:N-acetylneuraminate synthase
MSTFIIAEAGVNHNGSMDMARKLIDVAADAGANAVKFQTFRADALVAAGAPKAEYQLKTTDREESQAEMLRALELSPEQHHTIVAHCEERDIQFLSTPFDTDSARFLVETFDVPRIKIPSGEITNGPLLLHVARFGRPVILSTGMSTLAEVEKALSVLAFGYTQEGEPPNKRNFQKAFASAKGQAALQDNVTLLHCVTEYPAPVETVHLRAMDTLHQAFGLPVGLSDHTLGITVPIGAVARGASVLEKHFTLDASLPGPDHAASLEPDQLQSMVKGIRDVEAALGLSVKAPRGPEWRNRAIVRKSLVATASIDKGELFTSENLGAKRPATGISPMRYWAYVGQNATRSYQPDELIKE